MTRTDRLQHQVTSVSALSIITLGLFASGQVIGIALFVVLLLSAWSERNWIIALLAPVALVALTLGWRGTFLYDVPLKTTLLIIGLMFCGTSWILAASRFHRSRRNSLYAAVASVTLAIAWHLFLAFWHFGRSGV